MLFFRNLENKILELIKLKVKMRKITGLILIASMLATSFSIDVNAAKSKYYDTENEYHSDYDFDEIEYMPIDDGYGTDLANKLSADIDNGCTVDVIIQDMEAIIEAFDHITTEYSICNIYYDKNPSDDYYKSENERVFNIYVDSSDCMYIAMSKLAKSDYKYVITDYFGDEDYVDYFASYKETTDEEKARSKKIHELQSTMDELSMENYTYNYMGKDWDYDSIYESNDLDYEDFITIYSGLIQTQNEAMAPFYVELVGLLNEQAKYYGYDNYADYAYKVIYAKDYGHEELESLYEEVKKYIVPIYKKYETNMEYDDELPELNMYTGDELIEIVEPYIHEIQPELEDAFGYLKEHKLYDMDPDYSKLGVGFTITLPDYGSAFIFNDPYSDTNTIATLVHEFGHYNAFYHNTRESIIDFNNLDVNEIHSQGLEMLFLAYADEVYGDYSEAIREDNILKMLNSIVDGCCQDEFQYRVYTYDGELTVDVVNDIFAEVAADYGYDGYLEDVYRYYWVFISHNYQSPFYYISYCVSAFSALDILSLSEENRADAIDKYMQITALDPSYGYKESIEMVGLTDIFESGNATSIVQKVTGLSVEEDITEVEDEGTVIELHNETEDYRHIIRIAIVVILIIDILIASIIVIIVLKRRRKRADKKADSETNLP